MYIIIVNVRLKYFEVFQTVKLFVRKKLTEYKKLKITKN